MRNFLFVLILFFLPTVFAQAPSCLSRTGADWDARIQQYLSTSYGGLHSIQRELSDLPQSCKEDLERRGLNACLDRIEGYARNVSMGKGMFTALKTDKEYYDSQPPGLTDLPPELQNSRNGLPANWKDLAQKKGWQWALFHSGTADEPRLVIRMPGGDYDRLLVYYTLNRNTHDPTNFQGLQMQAIEKRRDGKPVPPPPPKYWFASWNFKGSNGHPQKDASGGRCVSCHVSGPRALVPQKNPVFPTSVGGVRDLNELNQLITHKGPLDYSPYYDPKYFPSHINLNGKTTCARCHDGKMRQSLMYSLDMFGNFYTADMHRKIVTEETMPMNPWLPTGTNPERRSGMVSDLAAEHREKLNTWLTETKCASIKSSHEPAPAPQPGGRQ